LSKIKYLLKYNASIILWWDTKVYWAARLKLAVAEKYGIQCEYSNIDKYKTLLIETNRAADW